MKPCVLFYIYLFASILYTNGFLNNSFKKRNTLTIKMALNDITKSRISEVKQRLEKIDADLKGDLSFFKADEIKEMNEELNRSKTIMSSVKALEDIDRDIEIFNDSLNGSDEKIKETAQIFIKEFTECKFSIEEQLNKMFSD